MPTRDSSANTTANVATGVAGGSGIVGFVAENAAMISISIAVASLLIAVLFHILNYRMNKDRLAMEREEHEFRMKHLAPYKNYNQGRPPTGYAPIRDTDANPTPPGRE